MPKAMKDNYRSFKVVKSSTGFTGGRYVAADPSTAAKNAAKIVFRALDAKSKGSENSVTLTIEETTRVIDAKHKEFSYRVTRTKLTGNDAKLNLDFAKKKKIVANYKYDVKAL